MFCDEKVLSRHRWEQPGFRSDRSTSASLEQTRSFRNARVSREARRSRGWSAKQKCNQVPPGVGRGPGVRTLTTNEKEKERKAVGRRGGEREEDPQRNGKGQNGEGRSEWQWRRICVGGAQGQIRVRTKSSESGSLSQVTGGKNEPALRSLLHSEKTIPKFICTSNIYLDIQITRLLGTGMSVLKENPKAGFKGREGSPIAQPHPPYRSGATKLRGSPRLKGR